MKSNGSVEIESGLYSTDSEFMSELKRELQGFLEVKVAKSVQNIMTTVETKLDETIEQTLQPILWELAAQRQKVNA